MNKLVQEISVNPNEIALSNNNAFYASENDLITDLNDLINIISSNSVEIVFRTRMPFMCHGVSDYYGVCKELRIGDCWITGYQDMNQDMMKSLKQLMIKDLNILIEKLKTDDEKA